MTFPGSLSLSFLPRRLTLLLAAAAIALAGVSATPRQAQASTDDILRFLAGVIIVAAIINAVDDNHRPQYISRWVLPDSCLETVRANWRTIDVYNARCLDRAGYHGLPHQCRYDYQYQGRNRSGYVAECMWDAGYRRQGAQPVVPPQVQGQVLPSHCAMTYRQSGVRVNGYWAGCLTNAGLHNLPRQCRVTSTAGDAIYNADCLVDAGYRRAGR